LITEFKDRNPKERKERKERVVKGNLEKDDQNQQMLIESRL
jgi:hypothetical protein